MKKRIKLKTGSEINLYSSHMNYSSLIKEKTAGKLILG
jgi:hypothetical protein